jgi:hypothetical protein
MQFRVFRIGRTLVGEMVVPVLVALDMPKVSRLQRVVSITVNAENHTSGQAEHAAGQHS